MEVTPQKDIPASAQAYVHLLMPFYIPHAKSFRRRLLNAKQWNNVNLETCFYLRYIDTIFCNAKDDPAENPFTARCIVMENTDFQAIMTVRKHELRIEKARLFCFDTSIGLLDLCITFSCGNMEDVANICARLRQTDLAYKVSFLQRETGEYSDKRKISGNALARELLTPLGKHRFYDHLGPCGATRAELFASVIAEGQPTESMDTYMYSIAQGVDMRDDEPVSMGEIYCPLPHLRWAITRKGACSVGILTNNPLNRNFVQNKWHSIVSNRHILWYMLVLHQKYAIYHYLNEIAQKKKPSDLTSFQKEVMAFNTKYRFEVIAEDPTYQIPYEKAREAKSVEQVFGDIDEEIERIHTYHNSVREKNTNVAMTIVSLVCAISTFIDIFSLSLLEQPLYQALQNVSVPQVVLYSVTVCAMVIALIYLVIKPILVKIKDWLQDGESWLLKICLLRKQKREEKKKEKEDA